MTESRIFHVESDEIAQSGDFDLFERLKNNEKPITDTEINIYVDGLVKVLKKISKNKERKSLLQKIFSVFESNKGLSLKKTVILRDFPSDSNNYSYEMGLERNDLKLLKSLLEIFKGKAVGLQSLAAILGEEEENIREVYEPFLLRAGLIERTSKGRTITPKGIEYLKKK